MQLTHTLFFIPQYFQRHDVLKLILIWNENLVITGRNYFNY